MVINLKLFLVKFLKNNVAKNAPKETQPNHGIILKTDPLFLEIQLLNIKVILSGFRFLYKGSVKNIRIPNSKVDK